MNYRKSVSSSQFVTVVDGKKHQEKDIYVRENIGDKTTFIKHMEIGKHAKSMAGTTHKGKMKVVTRVTDGNKVKYSSNVVKTPSNLRNVIRKSLILNKSTKRKTRGKKSSGRKTKGKKRSGSNKGKQIGEKGSKSKGKGSKSKGKGSKSKGKGKKGKTRKSSGSK